MSEQAWTGPPLDHLERIHAELKVALGLQLAELASLDERAARLLTPAGILLGLGVATATRLQARMPVIDPIAGCGLLMILASFTAGVYALRLRNVEVASTAAMWPVYAAVSAEQMLALECSTAANVLDNNARLRHLKSPWIICQFWTLIGGTTLIALGFLLRITGVLA